MKTAVLLILLLVVGLTPVQSQTSYNNAYLPMTPIAAKPMWGTEYYPGNITGTYKALFERLQPEFIRLQATWPTIEATRGVYNWGALPADIAEAQSHGAKVMLTIKMAPIWVVKPGDTCDGRIVDFVSFGQFVRAVVQKFPTVEYIEIGNEIDAPMGMGYCPYYGAWGDPDDEYWGGGYYASVLNLATPIIRAAGMKVVFGGLMLPMHNPDMIKYLEGAILAGADFDYYNFHLYVYHTQTWAEVQDKLPQALDYIIGLQDKYNLHKPIFLTETAYLCHNCPYDQDIPTANIAGWDWQYQVQWAEYVREVMETDYSQHVEGWLWYDGVSNPWGSYCGMIFRGGTPKPVYDYLEGTR